MFWNKKLGPPLLLKNGERLKTAEPLGLYSTSPKTNWRQRAASPRRPSPTLSWGKPYP